jgi:hypothetical protein
MVPSMRRAVTFSLAFLAGHSLARADEAPISTTFAYSTYELDAIRSAESVVGSSVDPAPTGKVVERIDTVRLDPIEERDPLPLGVDRLHTTTKPDVILREVLVRVGEPFSQLAVDETARNLRTLPQLSLVLCVPMRGSATDRVRLVVITKDVWSLYPDFDFAITSGGLENLLLEPKETNLMGRQETLLGRLVLQPKSWSLGVGYVVPRLSGRWLTLTADGNVILNRATGSPEGSFGTVSIARPLYSTRTEWAWSTAMTWRDELYRRYTNAEVATFEGTLPWQYRSRKIDQQASVTRSFGWAKKLDVTLGVDAAREIYRVPEDTSYDPKTVDRFVLAALPTGETRVGPFAQVRAYTTDFVRILDFETLGLQEDYRTGHDLVVRAYPVIKALGSSRDLLGMRAAAAYTIGIGDGLARAWIDAVTEAESSRITDGSVSADLRLVSPRTGLGRIVLDATATNRWRNYLNRTSTVGGDDRLRGYPTRFFVGKDTAATNVEFRTRPVEFASCQFGGAVFYDVAGAFDGFDHVQTGHTVGFGLRAVFPQIERVVLRGDIGFPIGGGLPPGVAPASFLVTFGQAFRAAGIPAPFGP